MQIEVPNFYKNIIVTGGAGFIGGCLIRRLLKTTNSKIYNIDKCGYASDLTGINNEIKELRIQDSNRHILVKIDISNRKVLEEAILGIDPDLVIHLAAESHVDRSIAGPDAFISSNILGTYNLLEVLKNHFENLPKERRDNFRFHHVSTDEVFGSIEGQSKFSEKSPYSPNSPYSATKAASDHLVKSWKSTYGFPVSVSNCSNNYGPWQKPDKLIPLTIYKAIKNEFIPIYGAGENIRDWLFVEDHVEAILHIAFKASKGSSYCVGGCNELSNINIVKMICNFLDKKLPKSDNYQKQITFVNDRPGHDFRYAIDNSLIFDELGWEPNYSFKEGLNLTIDWYLNNMKWCENVLNN